MQILDHVKHLKRYIKLNKVKRLLATHSGLENRYSNDTSKEHPNRRLSYHLVIDIQP